MEIWFLDDYFQISSMPIEDFSSFEWTENWNEPGSYILYLDFKYFPEIANSRYIYNSEARKAATIETINYTQASGNKVKITGRTLEALLERRVAQVSWHSTSDALVEESAYAAFQRFASPTSNRSLEGMTAGDHVQGYTETGAVAVAAGDNLLDFYYSVLPVHGMSPLVVYDFDLESLYLTCLHQTDRTIDNVDGFSPILLSGSFENVKNENYGYDETELVNHAYVVMEKDPCYGRRTVEVDTAQEGEPRVETYVVSNASSEPENVDGVLTPTVTIAECLAEMRQEGMEALEGQSIQESVSCEMEQNGVYEYRRDFFVGDIVSYNSGIIGVEMDAQITSVTETYENGAKKLSIRIGRDFSAVNYLRKMVKEYKTKK